jgi:hypothetical protein
MSAAATFTGWFRRTRPRPVEGERRRDSSVSFAELVWAHFERQKELYRGERDGVWEQEYRRRLAVFKHQQGEVVDAWWCRHEASAVVLTEKCLPRRMSRLWRREYRLRLHAATDWRAASVPEISTALHQCETMANKISEILRGSTERVALHWLFSIASGLLASVDTPPERAVDRREIRKVVATHDQEMHGVNDYYRRAGENSARIVYFGGMVRGAFLLAIPVGLGAILYDPGFGVASTEAQILLCTVMGAIGAIVSVMTRMASSSSGFSLDFEVGRKPVRRLGSFRPFIGAVFALALFLALRSGLLDVPKELDNIYTYATVSFLAGFSERRAKVLLDSAGAGVGIDPAPPVAHAQSGPTTA